MTLVELGRKKRRWPGRLAFFLVFLVFESAAFLTLGSLLFEHVEAGWARWLCAFGAALAAPIFLAALLAGRAREQRVGKTFRFGFLVLLLLGAGIPWLVARDSTRGAVARNGLWVVEQVAGPRAPETREAWQRFFLSDSAAASAPAPTPTPAPAPAPTPAPAAPSGGAAIPTPAAPGPAAPPATPPRAGSGSR